MENIIRNGTNWGSEADKLNDNFKTDSIKDVAFAVNVDTPTGEHKILDGSKANFFDIYLDREHTVINNISNMRLGEKYIIQVRQDAGGKNHLHWGTRTENQNLEVTTYPVMGSYVDIVITGTFDWSSLSTIPQIKSKLKITGLTENPMNCSGLVVENFDESTNTITVYNPFKSSLTGEVGTTGVNIEVTTSNYFFPIEEDNWISTEPFGVTMFEVWSFEPGFTSIKKVGIHTSETRYKSRARIIQSISDDFVGGDDNGILEWYESKLNGTVASRNTKVDENHFGIIGQKLDGGATSARCNMRLQPDGFVLTNSKSVLEFVQINEPNFFALVGTKSYLGWNDGNNNPNSISDGFYFEIVSNGDSTARVWCVAKKNSVKTEYDTGINLNEDTWNVFTIQIPSTFNYARFYINDVEVLELTDVTNFPTAKLTPFFGCTHNGDPLAKAIYNGTDMASLKYKINEDRI